jgi:pimeloyl-ACP methyl ester carboxylesterase
VAARGFVRAACGVAALLTLAACAGGAPSGSSVSSATAPSAATSVPPSAVASLVAASPSSAGIDASFDIGGGRHLHLECIGSGEPTIVIDVGNDDTIHGSWDGVFFPMSHVSRTCAYDRANLGRSDAALGPRTIVDVSEELVKLLDVAGIHGPIVFVGGSFGGNLLGVLASRHPELVAGSVFVDSEPAAELSHNPVKVNLTAAQWDACCAKQFGAPAVDDPGNTEHIDYAAGFADELASIGRQPKVPTIVLTATRFDDCLTGWPCDAILASEYALQALWIAGNPQGSQEKVQSGHVVQRENPDAIVDAARRVVEQVRSR